MKKNQIIILGIFTLITALIYWRLSSTKKDDVKSVKKAAQEMYVPVREVKNEIRKLQIVSYGQVSPTIELDISFEVQGRLMKGAKHLKPGMKFSKGELLYKVDAVESTYSLNARKTQLANLIISALPDIEMDYPSELNKWISFLNKIQPNEPLPGLPNLNSGKERMFFTSRTVLSEYYTVKSMEERISKFNFFAPFSGTVIEVYTEPGAIAGPGVRIAKIAQTGDYEVMVPITMNYIEEYKEKSSAEFLNADNTVIGTGKILRISDVINKNTQSADVYYSIRPVDGHKIYNGEFVTVSINKTAEIASMAVPTVAVKDNHVLLLENNKLVEKQINVVSDKPDTLYISGLKDGDKVVLEQVISDPDVATFKGIQR